MKGNAMQNSEYHRQRSKASIEMRLKFAHAYNNLLRGRVKIAKNSGGIKLLSATAAGFGSESYSEKAAYKTRRVMASKMMKDPLVIKTLAELGLKPNPVKPNEWIIDNSTGENTGSHSHVSD